MIYSDFILVLSKGFSQIAILVLLTLTRECHLMSWQLDFSKKRFLNIGQCYIFECMLPFVVIQNLILSS